MIGHKGRIFVGSDKKLIQSALESPPAFALPMVAKDSLLSPMFPCVPSQCTIAMETQSCEHSCPAQPMVEGGSLVTAAQAHTSHVDMNYYRTASIRTPEIGWAAKECYACAHSGEMMCVAHA